MKKEVRITTEYINLGQFLKLTDHIGNGGEARFFLMEERVLVNGEEETRRGRKLYPEDTVQIKDQEYRVVK